jgi:hypothetical protein
MRCHTINSVEESGQRNTLLLVGIIPVVLVVHGFDGSSKLLGKFSRSCIGTCSVSAPSFTCAGGCCVAILGVFIAAVETCAIDVFEEDNAAPGEAVEEHTEVFFRERWFEEGNAVDFEAEHAGDGEGEGCFARARFTMKEVATSAKVS